VRPTIDEVVLIPEALTDAQAEISQMHTARVDEAFRAVHTPVYDEAMQMLVAPTKGYLPRSVQVGDGAVSTNEQSAPDQRADAAQDDAQLVHTASGGGIRLRHLGIMARLAPSPVAPSPSLQATRSPRSPVEQAAPARRRGAKKRDQVHQPGEPDLDKHARQ